MRAPKSCLNVFIDAMSRLELNGWKIDFYPGLFEERYDDLVRSVTQLVKQAREDVANHPDTRLLQSLNQIFEEVSQDPAAKQFVMGATIGDNNWRRVKSRLPQRMRLFFRFSTEHKRIVFVWLNDKSTLRKAGSKTDVYEVFEGMLKSGHPPKDFKSLVSAVDSEAERKAKEKAEERKMTQRRVSGYIQSAPPSE